MHMHPQLIYGCINRTKAQAVPQLANEIVCRERKKQKSPSEANLTTGVINRLIRQCLIRHTLTRKTYRVTDQATHTRPRATGLANFRKKDKFMQICNSFISATAARNSPWTSEGFSAKNVLHSVHTPKKNLAVYSTTYCK